MKDECKVLADGLFDILKQVYPQADNWYVSQSKKGKWFLTTTNDNTLQHGEGNTVIITNEFAKFITARIEQLSSAEWEKALLSLTCGGSEFVDDPKRCVEYVKDIQAMQHKQIVSLTKRLKEAEQLSSVEGVRAEELWRKNLELMRRLYNTVDGIWKSEAMEELRQAMLDTQKFIDIAAISEALSLKGNEFSCSRNGIKRDGESCSLNNQCTYPECAVSPATKEPFTTLGDYFLMPEATNNNTAATPLDYDAVYFTEWLDKNGYRIHGWDTNQRVEVYQKYKSETATQTPPKAEPRQICFTEETGKQIDGYEYLAPPKAEQELLPHERDLLINGRFDNPVSDEAPPVQAEQPTEKVDEVSANPLFNKYDDSFDHYKTAWRHIVRAEELVGWKTFYFMVLDIQNEAGKDSNYKLLKSH